MGALWRQKRWLVIGVITLIVVAVPASLGGWLLIHRDSGSIPAKYTEGLDFTVYYPTKLPTGYHVDTHSFERHDDVLIYNIASPGGRTIAVSLQQKPDNVFAPSVPDKTFKTATGTAYIGAWGSNYVADIVTSDNTWIILNVNSFTADEATRITQSFTQPHK